MADMTIDLRTLINEAWNNTLEEDSVRRGVLG